MGSWSVYCGVSNIAITAGDECVLLPLKRAETRESYLPYLPACLPIFGTYDDYGGLEDIQKDDNTALIEEHFGVSIDEFVTFFVDGKYTYQRDEYEEVRTKIANLEEIEDWRFMFIDRKVFDFMITYIDDHEKGYFDFGHPAIMKSLGFEYVGEDKENKCYDPKRFCQKWKHGRKSFLSDGQTILNGIGKGSSYLHYIDHTDSPESSLSNYIKIPEDMLWVKEKAGWQLWRLAEKGKRLENLYILGERVYDSLFDDLLALTEKAGYKPEYKTLLSKYKRDYEQFGDRIADLITLRNNLYPMSGYFNPFVLYLTPQCGEHEHHQVLLEKFTEINKAKCAEFAE